MDEHIKKKYKILDLFCGAGGAGYGYWLSGFDVVGIDNVDQPKYPSCMKFIKDDAFNYLEKYYYKYDAIHASPPCQKHTKAGKVARSKGKVYRCYISELRDILAKTGKLYVIENVPGSPLINPIMLCGAMFGLKTYRHRLFESNIVLIVPGHPEHIAPNCKMGRKPKEGEFIQVVGHFSGVPFAKKAMGINWMVQKELAQSIPPAYTQFIGGQLIKFLNGHTH